MRKPNKSEDNIRLQRRRLKKPRYPSKRAKAISRSKKVPPDQGANAVKEAKKKISVLAGYMSINMDSKWERKKVLFDRPPLARSNPDGVPDQVREKETNKNNHRNQTSHHRRWTDSYATSREVEGRMRSSLACLDSVPVSVWSSRPSVSCACSSSSSTIRVGSSPGAYCWLDLSG